MAKTYYKKESKVLWYFIILLAIGLLIFGYTLVRYVAWQVIPIFFIAIAKINSISKKPEQELIILDDNGLTVINKTLGNQFYAYDDIKAIKMQSKALNGYIKLKSKKFKIRIDTVALDLVDQQEIETLVKAKITQ